jgi:hypothetical protein
MGNHDGEDWQDRDQIVKYFAGHNMQFIYPIDFGKPNHSWIF